jgi:hypothetical protein
MDDQTILNLFESVRQEMGSVRLESGSLRQELRDGFQRIEALLDRQIAELESEPIPERREFRPRNQ